MPQKRRTETDEYIADVPPGWPERVIELGRSWMTEPRARGESLARLWLLLNAALRKYLRIHAGRYGAVDWEDLQDIASEKSLEIIRKLDHGQWDPTASKPAQLCSFISTLARNGLVDHLRVIESKRHGGVGRAAGAERVAREYQEASGDVAVDRDRFTQALRDCVSQLKPKTRTIWFLRVLLEMPSKKIAHHPEVGLNSAAVDVTLARCRNKVRKCMQAKGFDPHDMPPGTFTTLWEAFRYTLNPKDDE